MVRRFGSYVRGQWAGFLALFLVLTGGVAYAANTVFSSDIVDGQVKTADLAAAAVTTAKLAGGAVTTDKVKDGTLAGRDVLDNSLRGADIDESTLNGVGSLRAPESWHAVAAGSTTQDLCANEVNTAVFCSEFLGESGYSPWRNYGSPHPTAAFYEDQLGIVHLKGVVVPPSTSISPVPFDLPIFRLPAAYQPETNRIFPSIGAAMDGDAQVLQEAAGRVDVQADGLVVVEADCTETRGVCSANSSYLTLDGIAFRPDE